MKQNDWKIRLSSRRNERRNLLDIYCINAAGEEEYLMSSHYDKSVHDLIPEGGASIGEIKECRARAFISRRLTRNRQSRGRIKCRRNRSRKLENTINHILAVFRDYIVYESNCPDIA